MPFDQENLVYPAVIIGYNGGPQTYLSSVQTGINNLVGEINDLAVTCPYTNIILAGYSRGADVIGQSIGVYHGSYTIPAISSAGRAKISSVILFGDPNYRPGETWDATGDGTAGGIFEKPVADYSTTYRSEFLPPSYTVFGQVTTVQSYCFTGDEFCQNAGLQGASVHASYKSSTAPKRAWTFLSGFLESND